MRVRRLLEPTRTPQWLRTAARRATHPQLHTNRSDLARGPELDLAEQQPVTCGAGRSAKPFAYPAQKRAELGLDRVERHCTHAVAASRARRRGSRRSRSRAARADPDTWLYGEPRRPSTLDDSAFRHELLWCCRTRGPRRRAQRRGRVESFPTVAWSRRGVAARLSRVIVSGA